MERDKREEIYSYADLQELASRVGVFLLGAGVAAGERMMLWAKNCPEWSMAYFGVLEGGRHRGAGRPRAEDGRAGQRRARLGRHRDADWRRPAREEGERWSAAFAEAGLPTKLWPFSEVFALPELDVERERGAKLVRRASPDALASLIFTSGTTGKPKGVMLTHRNFTFMVSELSKIFEFGVNDGMLSVLPLHHTFEFATGLLVPLAHGAQVTYLAELTGEAISSTLKQGRVTAIVGVPALWDLLRRRLFQRFADKSPILEAFMKVLAAELRAPFANGLRPRHVDFPARARGVRRSHPLPHQRRLGAAGRRDESLLRDRLQLLRGLRPHRDGAGPHRHLARGEADRRLGRAPAARHRGQDRRGRRASGVGEVIARGRNVMAGYWENETATAAAIRDGWFHTGDLGRFDENGNLYLVGRSKDVIVDANGKNVYPDEIEELYLESPYIKELSVVGVPDGIGEQVACAVVPDLEHEPALSRGEVEAKIEEHFRKVSADLPIWKRVRGVYFWEEDLPKTAKRSVMRRDVAAEIARQRKKTEETKGALAVASGDKSEVAWLLETIATVSGRRRGDVQLGSRFGQLGFDSLMYAELSSALENAGAVLPESVDITTLGTVAELQELLARGPVAAARERAASATSDDDSEIHVPSAVSAAGKRGLGLAQKLFYNRVLETKVKGKIHIPQHTSFIVAANHASHLDMGAVKVALGDAGKDLASMAAADYFFRNRYRRAYFKHFTNLVPMERSGSIRKSMDTTLEVLARGRSMVVFPEGTRSVTGELAEFLPSLGYLALRAGVGILPAHIAGSFESLPKGSAIPRARDLIVSFGPFLAADWLASLTKGLTQQESWRLCAAFTQRAVENLRDGVATALDVDAARDAWDGGKLGPIAVRAKLPRRRALRSVP